jgi:transcriptional regulator with XRE-family HTH domain
MEPSEAVKELRKQLGESQQAFATRLGLSISAVVNYEGGRTPTGRVLIALTRAAMEAGRHDLAHLFQAALANELKIREGVLPQTIEENVIVGILLLVMRERQGILGVPTLGHPEITAKYRLIRDTLIESADFLLNKFVPGHMYVYGLNESGFEALKAEVDAIKREVAAEKKL